MHKALERRIDRLLDILLPARRGGVAGYLIAAALTVGALLVRLAIAPAEAGLPFLTFFPAVTVAAVLGGIGPALFATVAGSIIGTFMFFPPYVALPLTFYSDVIASNAVFFAEEMTVILLIEAMYRQRRYYVTAAGALKRIQSDTKEQHRLNRALRLLSDCNMMLAHADDEPTLLADICRLIVDTGGYVMAWIGFAGHDPGKSVRPVAQCGYEDGYLESIRISWDEALEIGRGPTGTAIRTGTTQVNQDYATNPSMAPWREAANRRGYQSSIALPIICQRQMTLGALTLYAAEPEAFTAEEVALLEELARNLAYGIQTLRARAERDAAEAATRAKSAFLANMSHEIRTPLNVIVGISHLLDQELPDPRHRRRLDQLRSTADHLMSIINDILDLSKIEADRLVLDESPFRLGELAERVVGLLEEPARAKGLDLAVDLAPALGDTWLRGDAARLAQVLVNLVGNAVKFTKQGTVRLTIGCLDEAADPLRLRFTVADTGIGIATADQVRLFEAFEQADNSTTRRYGGTGLGLAISRRLVGLMGGAIAVASQPGEGSTFSFDLALGRGENLPEAPPATHGTGQRVLVAEDHALSREILFEQLNHLGYWVELAENGAEAVECARHHAYDLILMDLHMPVLDGLAAARAIRALPAHRLTPILALTADTFIEDQQRALEAGMNGYLSKPLKPADLAATLGQWLAPATAIRVEATPGDPLSRALDAIAGLDGNCLARRPRNNPDAYRQFLEQYLQLHANDMARLRQHLAAGDREAAYQVVHQLKGGSAMVGARHIKTLAATLSRALRAGQEAPDLEPLVADCEAELMGLAAAIQALPDNPPTPPAPASGGSQPLPTDRGA